MGCGGTGGDVEPICSRPSDAASADVLVDALCDASSLRGQRTKSLNHTKTARLWYSAVGSAPEMSYLRIHDRIPLSPRAYRWKDVLLETLATCYNFWKSDTTTATVWCLHHPWTSYTGCHMCTGPCWSILRKAMSSDVLLTLENLSESIQQNPPWHASPRQARWTTCHKITNMSHEFYISKLRAWKLPQPGRNVENQWKSTIIHTSLGTAKDLMWKNANMNVESGRSKPLCRHLSPVVANRMLCCSSPPWKQNENIIWHR